MDALGEPPEELQKLDMDEAIWAPQAPLAGHEDLDEESLFAPLQGQETEGPLPAAAVEVLPPLEGQAVQEQGEGPADVQEPAAKAAPPVPARDAVRRERAEIFCNVTGGKITYYPKGEYFTATCEAAGHTRCVLTRTAKSGRKAAQGRPRGLLLGWLAKGPGLPNKEAHFDRNNWPSHAERSAARAAFAASDLGEVMLPIERGLALGESEEPEAFA